jgi:hypothetical protein
MDSNVGKILRPQVMPSCHYSAAGQGQVAGDVAGLGTV